MSDMHERDFVGYGRQPPDPKWPGGARIAVNFVINYEEGSEYSIPEGDGFSEAALTELAGAEFKPGVRNLAAEGAFEYGSRVGFWRLVRLFEKFSLPVTIFGCAMALERNAEAAAAIRELGYDVCCHGWRWEKHWELSEAEEREHIARAVASLTATVGERPLGWYCRTGPGINTRRLLAEEGGFLYDSDAYNDDLPYWRRVDGKPYLVVPYSLTNNDTKFPRGSFGTGDDYFAFMRDAFDMQYAEGNTMMSVGLHMRIIGHAARAAGLARFLAHVASKPDVWVCRRIDIARHWTANNQMATEIGPR